MTPAELKTLIEADADALAKYQAGKLQACAHRCSEIAPQLRKPVEAMELERYAALSGVLAKIILARESTETPVELRAVCITFLYWMEKDRSINFDLPEIQASLAALVQAGLVTAEQSSELTALGSYPLTFTTDEILAAMRG